MMLGFSLAWTCPGLVCMLSHHCAFTCAALFLLLEIMPDLRQQKEVNTFKRLLKISISQSPQIQSGELTLPHTIEKILNQIDYNKKGL